MTYSIKEIHYTLQGEGANTGYPVVLIRFTGCNLWSGKEEDRNAATCQFCDTDFVGTDGPGGGRYDSPTVLCDAVDSSWRGKGAKSRPHYVLCTGGEPLLQLDSQLISALHARDYRVAVESNGTVPAPSGVDWLCVSPKKGAELKQIKGEELKLVYPQADLDPEVFLDLEFGCFSLQPKGGPDLQSNTQVTLEYCLANPRWRLSLQTHKILDIP